MPAETKQKNGRPAGRPFSFFEELPELPSSTQEGSQMTLELENSLARLRQAEQQDGEGPEDPVEQP